MSCLPGYCSIKGCERPRVGSLKVCESHRKLSADEKKLKIEKPLTGLRRGSPPKKQSDKRAGQMEQYYKRVEVWKKGKICVVCDHEGLKKPVDDCHHMAGKENDRLLDESLWIPMCRKHHIYFTEHSAEAIAMGYSLPRNSTTI